MDAKRKALGKRHKPERDERRENLLRPSPYLGYDRDDIAMHLVEREAYEIAESQFRRAIWLNPFEAQFKEHLALCFYRQGRYAEAMEWIKKALEQEPGKEEFERVLRLIEQGMKTSRPDDGGK